MTNMSLCRAGRPGPALAAVLSGNMHARTGRVAVADVVNGSGVLAVHESAIPRGHVMQALDASCPDATFVIRLRTHLL